MLLSLIQLFPFDLLVQPIKQSVRDGWIDVHQSACESSVKGVIVRVYQVLQHIYIIEGVGVIEILSLLSLRVAFILSAKAHLMLSSSQVKKLIPRCFRYFCKSTVQELFSFVCLKVHGS